MRGTPGPRPEQWRYGYAMACGFQGCTARRAPKPYVYGRVSSQLS